MAKQYLKVSLPSVPWQLAEDGTLNTADVALVDCKCVRKILNIGADEGMHAFNDEELEVLALRAKAWQERESGSLWPAQYFAAEPVAVVEHPNPRRKSIRLIACHSYCQLWKYAPQCN